MRTRSNSERVKYLLGLCAFLAIGWVIYRLVFVEGPQQPVPSSTELNDLSDDANLSIQEVYHTATRNGIKEWSLKAQTARYVEEQHLIYLNELSVDFFMDNKERTHLTADQGVLHTETKDIDIKGNVVVDNAKYRLKTDTLQYKHKKRVLYSHAPVKIEGPSLYLLAQKMSFDLNTNMAVLEGEVKGAFFETHTP